MNVIVQFIQPRGIHYRFHPKVSYKDRIRPPESTRHSCTIWQQNSQRKLCPNLASSSFLQVLHVCGLLGSSKHFKMINPSNFISSLIVLHKKLDVLHVLELDKLQGDLLPIQLAL